MRISLDNQYFISAEVDADILDILDQCDDDDIKEIISYLENYDYITEYVRSNNTDDDRGLIPETRNKMLELSSRAYLFTEEEEHFLEKMYKKYL
jgi:hypothetical protein